MGVIINDLDVVVESPQQAADTADRATTGQQPSDPGRGPAPADVRRIIRRQQQRLERLWAH